MDINALLRASLEEVEDIKIREFLALTTGGGFPSNSEVKFCREQLLSLIAVLPKSWTNFDAWVCFNEYGETEKVFFSESSAMTYYNNRKTNNKNYPPKKIEAISL